MQTNEIIPIVNNKFNSSFEIFFCNIYYLKKKIVINIRSNFNNSNCKVTLIHRSSPVVYYLKKKEKIFK